MSKEFTTFKVNEETRKAAHTALETVLDRIERGEIEASFFVNNRLLDVNARKRIGKPYDTGWDMKKAFSEGLTQTDAEKIIYELDKVEGVVT